ncbi:MAG: aminotransferase class I/II-fold pyridoxal phosphate-dependent enzyme [Sphingobacteriales bacterium]|nr:aminotransferase class I/II-fold pyridoxal phosphate-dependent enzyme [Sphingobacteriales bacterium]
MIDLRSDTVTRPSPEMLEAMLAAQVGDDVFGEDPTVNLLEAKVAGLFQQEAGLFCASGTMANQIAVKAHTQPMDEIILDKTAHIYYYETAGFAFHSGVSVKLVNGARGLISAEQVRENIQPDFDWLPKTSLVCLENTSNKGGGSCYELQAIREIREVCLERNLKLHLDGARLFNAMVAKKYTPQQIGSLFDSVAICFSKGLGAPVGSVLVGNKEFIRKARRIRKAFGGGMRQAGYLAAACLYALENNRERLEEDHQNARRIGDTLQRLSWIKTVLPVETNILIFEINDKLTNVDTVLSYLKENEVAAVQFGRNQIRMVTHLDVTKEMAEAVCSILARFTPL